MKNFFLLFITVLFIGCQPNTKEALKFEITEKQKINYDDKVFRIKLNINKLPSKEDIKNTAINIWENTDKKGKLTTFIYLPEMDTNLFAYAVGEFNETGLIKFEINENSLSGTKWQKKKISTQKKEIITPPELKEYTINLSLKNKRNRNIRIDIKTNFPDGTKLLLGVSRTHYLRGNKDAYSGDIFNKDIMVRNGKIETTVKINDTQWYNSYQKLVIQAPDSFKPISKISDKIEISVMFSPRRDQSEDILKILGKDGEFVTGKGVDKSSSLTSFRVVKEFLMPFKK